MVKIRKVTVSLEEDVVNALKSRMKVGQTYSEIIRGLLDGKEN